MSASIHDSRADSRQHKLLLLPQQLLAMQATEVRAALDQASQLVVEACGADKVDVFLHDPSIDTLIAMGTSHTPLGDKQRAVGLDRLPLANGGRHVEVYLTGKPYYTGHAEEDSAVLLGIRETLQIRSLLVVPLEVQDQRRGIVSVAAQRPDAFSTEMLPVLQAVAQWIGMVTHRAELVEQIARDAAEQARRGVADELVTTLAHDLHNLLSPITGRISLMRRDAQREGNERFMRHAEKAAQGVQRMELLIKDLLDVARLEQGIYALERECINLTALAEEVASVIQTDDTEVRVQASDVVHADGDPARIRQVLENLVINAVQHSPKGAPVLVDIRQQHDQDGTWVVIQVRDEGPGIEPDLLPHIFSRFRAGAGSSGLGLGLHLAQSIVTAHGGSLSVESTVGTGSSFRITLPCCTADHTSETPSAA